MDRTARQELEDGLNFQYVRLYNVNPTSHEFNFDAWAKAVREQLLAVLSKQQTDKSDGAEG
ncbi:MAG: hypothetical protein HC890_01760 [Chloroflexaceae bacterium]|nr:hypothetical protein [Chloroflexaceae bacterium]